MGLRMEEIAQDFEFNSFWPGDVIWRRKTGSTMAQTMACCLTAPSHYQNQCWLHHQGGLVTITWRPLHTRFTSHHLLNWVEYHWYKISFKYPRGQWWVSDVYRLLQQPHGYTGNHCYHIVSRPWWRHQMEPFSALLALCAGNSPVPVNSPHKGQWRGALMFSLICAWINDWVNNREAGDLRRHRGHYDVNIMSLTLRKKRRQSTTSWHGNAGLITDPLWGESIGFWDNDILVNKSQRNLEKMHPNWWAYTYLWMNYVESIDIKNVAFNKSELFSYFTPYRK